MNHFTSYNGYQSLLSLWLARGDLSKKTNLELFARALESKGEIKIKDFGKRGLKWKPVKLKSISNGVVTND